MHLYTNEKIRLFPTFINNATKNNYPVSFPKKPHIHVPPPPPKQTTTTHWFSNNTCNILTVRCRRECGGEKNQISFSRAKLHVAESCSPQSMAVQVFVNHTTTSVLLLAVVKMLDNLICLLISYPTPPQTLQSTQSRLDSDCVWYLIVQSRNSKLLQTVLSLPKHALENNAY